MTDPGQCLRVMVVMGSSESDQTCTSLLGRRCDTEGGVRPVTPVVSESHHVLPRPGSGTVIFHRLGSARGLIGLRFWDGKGLSSGLPPRLVGTVRRRGSESKE